MTNSPELRCHYFLFAITIFILFPLLATSLSTLLATQTITSNQTIISSNETFELGFFTRSNPPKWYVGIWYKNIPDKIVVWVANRNNPLTNSSGVLKIGEDGNIVILDHANNLIWSTNQTKAAISPIAELLDSGNFILREENNAESTNYLWQSFDYPTDTLLPEMKLGWDLKTGFERKITSWKTPEDPSSGDYSFRIDPHGFPESYLGKGNVREYRTGPWNGIGFSGIPEMKPSSIINFIFETNQDEVSYSFTLNNNSVLSRLVVNSSTGLLQRFIWLESAWNPFWYFPKDQCDKYRECGRYGVCDTNASPVCKCMKGFEPKNPAAWSLRDGSDGCVRNVELDCQTDGFLLMGNMKLPESSSALVNQSMSLTECSMACQKDCSCTAFADRDITGGGTGCVMWTDDLLDMREFADGGQNLYVRMPASLLENGAKNGSKHGSKTIEVVAIAASTGILLCGIIMCIWKRKALQRLLNETHQEGSQERSQDFLIGEVVVPGRDHLDENKVDELELPLFDFSTVASATNEFSHENELGEGGFGCVYKAVWSDGQEVAVKRLSKTSRQGTEEFMNEVKLIARLQHRNLVRLLGCCVEKDEKMLIYEYLQNRSLDSILFNKERSSLLDWHTRYSIICGIARGLLYLHQDSRHRIIHRDLKASNILLDGELDPKISDFGMARIFGKDQTEGNTRRVVGTYGYMSPEYAMDGLFSVKSDVYSFGVLVLEIISGKKNRGFYSSDHELSLLVHAWSVWNEQRGLELTDPSAGNSYSIHEVLRYIQVGLLCVQEHAEDRPEMSSVVLMLSSETATMPQPKHPGFFSRRNPIETESSSSKKEVSSSVNRVTVTILDGR